MISDSRIFFKNTSRINHDIRSDKDTILDHNLIANHGIVSDAAYSDGAMRTNRNVLANNGFGK